VALSSRCQPGVTGRCANIKTAGKNAKTPQKSFGKHMATKVRKNFLKI
jgi:hypothetical protein